MNRIIIQHVAPRDPNFQAMAPESGKSTDSVPVPSPFDFPVEGLAKSVLMGELRWYLEKFLDAPLPPQKERAKRIQKALQLWGEQAFDALFRDGVGREMFAEATQEGHEQLLLLISSDDPQVLGWPWEALRDPEMGFLAQIGQVERRLIQIPRPKDVKKEWPKNQVNILLITARPYKDDVRYRSIAGPLVNLIDRERLPARVTVLRPPTFARLREHLDERPNHYHLVHFDGHGAYDKAPAHAGGGTTFDAPEGYLVFENDQGEPNKVEAGTLSHLLHEHHIPAVVLNACQSAKIDEKADYPFASVAASLLRTGIRSVVAMSYSLRVSGAEEFLPAFYRELFQSGSMAQATLAGRQKMYERRDRVWLRGRFPLDDWLVPVIYQHEKPFDFNFAIGAKPDDEAGASPELPAEARAEKNPYGFIGRDGAIRELERALWRPQAGILIRGLGGVGKTALARDFLEWLRDTDGLSRRVLWISFPSFRSAEHVINWMGEPVFDHDHSFSGRNINDKVSQLVETLKENQHIIVWDKFEVVRGIPDTKVGAYLSRDDQILLRDFLAKLRDGRSKVIITSSNDEAWLDPRDLTPIYLGGLKVEERWEYGKAILRAYNLDIDPTHPEQATLMGLLGGHPLAMRVVLPMLKDLLASELNRAFQSHLNDLGRGGDPMQDRLFATLRFAEQSLPGDLKPLLVPLALHERFVVAHCFEAMAQRVAPEWTRDRIDRFLETLTFAGLLSDREKDVFEMHPALTGFLRGTRRDVVSKDLADPWSRAFVDIMALEAEDFRHRSNPRQRRSFPILGTNFHHALTEAERLHINDRFAELARALAFFALDSRDFKGVKDLISRFFQRVQKAGDARGEVKADG
jgi:hypothetical protein